MENIVEVFDPFNEERPIGYKDELIEEVQNIFVMSENEIDGVVPIPDMIEVDYSFVVHRRYSIYLKDLEDLEGSIYDRVTEYMYKQEDLIMINSDDDCDEISDFQLVTCFDDDGEIYYN